MVTKTKISIGVLLLILLSTGVVYVEWKNDARLRVDNDKSTFYVPHEDYPWMWVVSGREYNKLYDGTSLMYRDVQNIKVETVYDSDTITIKRTTPFIRGPVIIDTYRFDGRLDDIELFPVSHIVEVLGAKGKFYRYEVKDLVYDGETFKLDGKQTYQEFGRNMKVIWWGDYRLGWVYKSGSMYVKSEKLASDYEVFNVRLFDPPEVNLYFNELSADRKYEYYTVANITANISDCSTDCEVCVDIDDSIQNITFPFGSKEYICGNQSISFLYNITTLRQNEFNDSTIAKNVTSASSVFISLDNRTDIDSFTFNITNNGTASENISIDVDEDNVYDEILLGQLTGTNLYTDSFYSDDIKYSRLNLTRTSAGTKTIYMNITTSGFDVNPIINFTFQLDGFTLDFDNDFIYNDNFTNITASGGTYNENISLLTEIDDFGDDDSSRWTEIETGGVIPIVDKDYLKLYASQESPGSETRNWYYNEKDFDMRDIHRFETVLDFNMRHECDFYYEDALFLNKIWITDGTTNKELIWDWDNNIDCGQYPEEHTYSETINLKMIKISENRFDVYYDDVYQSTETLGGLDLNRRQYLQFYSFVQLEEGETVSYSQYSLYNLSVSGISLKNNNSSYPVTAANYTSDSLNITINNIKRATLNTSFFDANNTTTRLFLSNDNQATWEEVSNGIAHIFTSSGKNISARIQIETINKSHTPRIYNYRVDITPTAVTDVLVDIGVNGNYEFNYTGTLNDTTSPQIFDSNGSSVQSYVNQNCEGNVTCYLPIAIIFGTPGTIQVSNSNMTLNPNSINVTTSLVEGFNPINLTFSTGNFELADVILDYKGSKNITFLAYYNNSLNDSHIMQVVYSKFNASLQVNISYFEFFPTSITQENVTPYGQKSTSAIWNITSFAYDEPFDAYVKTNETLSSCINYTLSNDSTKTGGLVLDTSIQEMCVNVLTLVNSGSCGNWVWVDLNNCSSRFEMDWFYWSAKCSDCVNTTDWEDTNLIVG